MPEKVFYEELFPNEFEKRILEHPIGYLPLGTLEWHGMQNVLGADGFQAREVFRLAAERFGGIVFPPVWLGPDRIISNESGDTLIGMDYAAETNPEQKLPGSCYWISKGVFINIIEAILQQAKRSGFKCIVADGHGPSRNVWGMMSSEWEYQYGLKIISAERDFKEGQWKTQNDHAGRNETSAMMAIRSDFVDLNKLSNDRKIWPTGVIGEDPRDSTIEYGNYIIECTVEQIGEKIKLIESNMIHT